MDGVGQPLRKTRPQFRPCALTALPPAPTDVLMLLMTDVLVFLQEKDQKYIFPALVSPSPPLCARPGAPAPRARLPEPEGAWTPPESSGHESDHWHDRRTRGS